MGRDLDVRLAVWTAWTATGILAEFVWVAGVAGGVRADYVLSLEHNCATIWLSLPIALCFLLVFLWLTCIGRLRYWIWFSGSDACLALP